jgi:hypothetical protein
VGVGVRAERTAGEGDRRRPAAVAAAAREKRRGRVLLGNTRPCEVYWGIGNQGE